MVALSRFAQRISSPLAIDAAPRGSLYDAEEGEETPHGEADAPRDVLVEYEGCRRKQHPDRSTHEGGHEDPVTRGFGPSHHGVAANQVPNSPKKERREQPRQEPGEQHVQR